MGNQFAHQVLDATSPSGRTVTGDGSEPETGALNLITA